MPDGTTFNGTIHRYEYPDRVSTTWTTHEGNIASNHRYSGKGRGAVYGGTSQQTAYKEISHYPGSVEGRIPVSRNVELDNVLDLTDPAVRQRLRVSLNDITGDSYQRTQPIGDWARGLGYNGILAPSARNKDGSNLIIFEGL